MANRGTSHPDEEAKSRHPVAKSTAFNQMTPELTARGTISIHERMTNTQILSVRVPVDMLERIDAQSGGRRSRFIREALEERLGRDAEAFTPRTAMGRKLAALRQRGLDSGSRLLDLEEVNREVARRRGRPE